MGQAGSVLQVICWTPWHPTRASTCRGERATASSNLSLWCSPLPPSAGGERRPTSTEPRMSTEPALWAVRSTAWLGGLGGCAASHVEGTRPAHTFRAILVNRPWVVVTVPALVLCARWLGWSRELATTSLVTGPVLIPFGRLQVFLSLPPPRLSCICFL